MFDMEGINKGAHKILKRKIELIEKTIAKKPKPKLRGGEERLHTSLWQSYAHACENVVGPSRTETKEEGFDGQVLEYIILLNVGCIWMSILLGF